LNTFLVILLLMSLVLIVMMAFGFIDLSF
jgi:hypothetical protein